MLGAVEIANLAAETDFEIGAVKTLDSTDATFAGTDLVPQLGNFESKRGDNPRSSDDNSPGHPENLSETERVFRQISASFRRGISKLSRLKVPGCEAQPARVSPV